jgi:hypothetical protein
MNTMATASKKRLVFRWAAPKNLLAIVLFVLISVLTQYVIIVFTIPMGAKDPTVVILPLLNVSVSLLYHVLPVAVTFALTASFTHLTIYMAMVPSRAQTPTRPSTRPPRGASQLRSLRRFLRKIRRAFRNLKNAFLKAPSVARIQRRVVLAKAIIKSAVTIVTTFVILVVIFTIGAYPRIVPTLTTGFFEWNTVFRGFVVATIDASQTIASTISPLGAVANALHDALIGAAPVFRGALEGAGSAVTSGLVALRPTEKYLIVQNAAAWITGIAALLYSQYVRIRRHRR